MRCVGRQLGLLYDDPHFCILKCTIHTVFINYSLINSNNDSNNNNNNNNNDNNNNNNNSDNNKRQGMGV